MYPQRIKTNFVFTIFFLMILFAFVEKQLFTAFGQKPFDNIKADTRKEPEKVEPINQVHMFAFSQLTDMLENDLADVDLKASALMAIYTQSPILTSQFEDYAIFHVMNSFRESTIKPIRCIECLTATAKLKDDEFIITRGFTSDKDLGPTLKKFKTTNYVATSVTISDTQMILGVSIHDHITKATLFQNEYRTPVYEIDRKGLQFFFGAGVIKFPQLAMTGGFIGFGQYFLGNGTTGLSVSTYGSKSSDEGQFYSLRYFVDLDLNHIVESYWLWGGLFFCLDAGVISTKNSLQSFAGPSLKITLGKSFFFQGGYYTSQILGRSAPKEDEEEDTTDTTLNDENILDTKEKLPDSLIGGFGIKF